MPPPPTARLAFGTWRATDSALATALWANPEVMQYLGGPYTPDEVRERLAREEANESAHGFQYWPVFAGETFAGCCGLKPYELSRKELEIGFHFLPAFWGAGYAREASEAVIAYAFGALQASALFAGCHPGNAASSTLLTRLGFTQIGTHFFARTGLEHPWWTLTR